MPETGVVLQLFSFLIVLAVKKYQQTKRFHRPVFFFEFNIQLRVELVCSNDVEKANPPRDGDAKSWTPPGLGRQTAEIFCLSEGRRCVSHNQNDLNLLKTREIR